METIGIDQGNLGSPAPSQVLQDFGALLLDTFDRLKAAGDAREMRVWLNWLHGDDKECLALALGKRELARLAEERVSLGLAP
jgi:hypothetical protein